MSLQKGEISESNVSNLEHLLCNCWDEFSGSDSEGMEACKLICRMKQVYLKYPILYFAVERHGGTVSGSKKAELHNWLIDIDKKQATCQKRRYVLTVPMQSS